MGIGADKRFLMCCHSPATEGVVTRLPEFSVIRDRNKHICRKTWSGGNGQAKKRSEGLHRKPIYVRRGISGMIEPMKCCKTLARETTIYIKDVLEDARIQRPRSHRPPCRLTAI